MQLKSILFALLAGLATVQGQALAQSLPAGPKQNTAIETLRSVQSGVRNFVFISRQASGWRQYAPRQTPLFKAGEALQFYAEPVNLGWSPRGQSYRFEMRVDVEIRTPEGQILWGQKDYGHLAHESPTADPNTYITGSVAVKGLAPGLYMLTVRFRDPLNNRTAEIEIAFGIVAEPRQIDA